MIDTINPTAKTIGLLGGTVLLGFTFQWQINLFIVLLCVLFLMTSKRVDVKNLGFLLIPILLLSVSYFFTGWLFQSDQPFWGLGAKNSVGLVNGLNLGTRLLAFGMLGLSYSLTTDSYDLVASLIQQARIPMKMGYAILTALNLTSLIKEEYQNSKLALQIRNIPVKPFDTKPLLTMMVRMVRWSDRLSLAMESKGFSEERMMKKKMKVSRKDFMFMLGFPIIIILLGLVYR